MIKLTLKWNGKVWLQKIVIIKEQTVWKCQFHYHFTISSFVKSFIRSFYVLLCLHPFVKWNWQKAVFKMQVKLRTGQIEILIFCTFHLSRHVIKQLAHSKSIFHSISLFHTFYFSFPLTFTFPPQTYFIFFSVFYLFHGH